MDEKKRKLRTADNKQERTVMKSKGAEGLPADPRDSTAANEDFVRTMEDLERLARSQAGWDPYDVWRTRVKNSSRVSDREVDPRR